MLLARLGGMPPTLYVPNEEPDAAHPQGSLLFISRLPCIGRLSSEV